SVVVLGLKFAAYWLTGSVALYSDALECTINVFAAIAAMVALRVSHKPADANHPYGHQKAEYFSAVIEGVLVILTAIAIFREAYLGWLHPHLPSAPFLGILLNAIASAMNLVWALYLIRFGRRAKSPAIVASGQHVMTDVWTSGGVLIGFTLVPLTQMPELDPAIAALVALNILRTGFIMVRDSVGSLMDQAVDPATLAKIRDVLSRRAEGALEVHDIRTRQAGAVTFVDFHLVVPRRMAVEDAHDICDRLEAALREVVGEAVISIHVEPEGKAKHQGVVVLP
ncbi:MAG TPA: cation diffusion facilitator family transporter, partial [Acetobacteraceae bacterium]|nr:cation diffusion facilitator family transporter [Acetobacteraceae bacterium]